MQSRKDLALSMVRPQPGWLARRARMSDPDRC
jgi:hypothetical protein